MATVCRSCRSIERSRRSRRRLAAPARATLLSPARGGQDMATQKQTHVVVVVVVLLTVCLTYVSVHIRPRDAPNWVAERLGASSRRPRHPFPALMAGVNPGRVPVYTALKSHQPNFTELQLWNLDRLLRVCTREPARAALWDSTVFSTPAPVDLARPAQQEHRSPCHVLQLGGWTMGICLCITTGMSLNT